MPTAPLLQMELAYARELDAAGNDVALPRIVTDPALPCGSAAMVTFQKILHQGNHLLRREGTILPPLSYEPRLGAARVAIPMQVGHATAALTPALQRTLAAANDLSDPCKLPLAQGQWQKILAIMAGAIPPNPSELRQERDWHKLFMPYYRCTTISSEVYSDLLVTCLLAGLLTHQQAHTSVCCVLICQPCGERSARIGF